MPVLEWSEYDQSYFEGNIGPLSHNAGYGSYARTNWLRTDLGQFGPESASRRGADNKYTPAYYFEDLAAMMTGRFNVNQEIVILGSAYGFLVHYLRQNGIEAWGVDVSQYAYDQADPAVQPYLTVQDALSWLQEQRRNQWDIIGSRWFMCCFDDAGATELIAEMNRVSRQQLHIFMREPNPIYYNAKTVQEWHDQFSWEVGTILVPDQDFGNYLTKIN